MRAVELRVSRRRHAVSVFIIALVAAAPALGEDIIRLPGASITVELSQQSAFRDRDELLSWVRRSAQSVAGFYGRFPVERLRLVVAPKPGRGISGGRTWADRGGLIRIRVGTASSEEDFVDDWMLVHEMTHLALPSLPDEQAWLEEGLATYVEPLARAQAGTLSEEAVWADYVAGMPNGLPRPGDRGLDRTPTWGRRYWGGALFCLVADLEIRRRTGNRIGLQHALRAILARGNLETSGEIGPILEAGDLATGVPVLAELYSRWRDRPVPVDLEGLWRDLGIRPMGRSVRLHDDAPDAVLRRALTAPPVSTL
jgi:hypothetical protein